jgi:hypothetical protein
MPPTVPDLARTRAASMESMDIEDSNSWPRKRSLATMNGVSAEWNSGSKKRVIKYYVAYAGVGLIVGAIIGIIIGLCVHFLS